MNFLYSSGGGGGAKEGGGDGEGDEPGKKKRRKGKPLCRPIICVCNDLYAQVMRPLRDVAAVFQFKQPLVRHPRPYPQMHTLAFHSLIFDAHLSKVPPLQKPATGRPLSPLCHSTDALHTLERWGLRELIECLHRGLALSDPLCWVLTVDGAPHQPDAPHLLEGEALR